MFVNKYLYKYNTALFKVSLKMFKNHGQWLELILFYYFNLAAHNFIYLWFITNIFNVCKRIFIEKYNQINNK